MGNFGVLLALLQPAYHNTCPSRRLSPEILDMGSVYAKLKKKSFSCLSFAVTRLSLLIKEERISHSL